jgi:hypothetical protein
MRENRRREYPSIKLLLMGVSPNSSTRFCLLHLT